MAIQRKYTNTRADFFNILNELLKQTDDLLRVHPGYPPFVSIGRQLKAMQGWTADEREPTPEERKKIQIGSVLTRELEPAPNDDIYEYMQKLYELSEYFQDWLTDEQRATLDEDDLSDFDD